MERIDATRISITQTEATTGFTGVPIDLPTVGPAAQSDREVTATPIPAPPKGYVGIRPVAVRGKRKAAGCPLCLIKAAIGPNSTTDASTQTELSRPFMIKASQIPTLPGITPEQNFNFNLTSSKCSPIKSLHFKSFFSFKFPFGCCQSVRVGSGSFLHLPVSRLLAA